MLPTLFYQRAVQLPHADNQLENCRLFTKNKGWPYPTFHVVHQRRKVKEKAKGKEREKEKARERARDIRISGPAITAALQAISLPIVPKARW